MQSCLTELYGLDLAYRIDDFLVTDRRLAHILGGVRRERDEELLIVEDERGAEVSLFLEQALVERLERDNPVTALSHRNLADFLVAFEGVSHFTYFAFKASKDECVSLLELELQAEVDKYATALLAGNGVGAIRERSRALRRRLFDRVEFLDAEGTEEGDRYRIANRLAARYVERLEARYLDRADLRALARELRRFYRMGLREKAEAAGGLGE